ncbi:MAG: hypothetical protein AAFQ82_01615 [Myxococcota bacterium]
MKRVCSMVAVVSAFALAGAPAVGWAQDASEDEEDVLEALIQGEEAALDDSSPEDPVAEEAQADEDDTEREADAESIEAQPTGAPIDEPASPPQPDPKDGAASEGEAGTEADLNQILNGPGVGATSKDWQFILSTSTAVSSGNFVSLEPSADPTFGNDVDVGRADRPGTVVQNFDLRFQWNFRVFGETLRARARWLADVEYTDPNSNPPNRVNPFDLAIDVTDMSLVSDETFGIVLGGVRFTLPTSRISAQRDRKTQASLFATWVKPFSNGVMLFSGGRLSYNVQDAVSGTCGLARSSETGGSNEDNLDGGNNCDAVPGSQALNSGDTQLSLNEGQTNPNWEGSVFVGTQYAATDKLTLSYSLSLILFTNAAIAEDEFTSPLAEGGRDLQNSLFSYALSANYVLNDALASLMGELPFNLSAGASLSAFHSTTDRDNEFYWPVFFSAFSDNRAADNSAQFSLSLIASY